MIKIIEDADYQQCCEIAEKLEEVDAKLLCQLLICIFANFKETRDYVLNTYCDLIE